MIDTKSKFYFGYEVTSTPINFYANFKEGAGPELTAILKRGYYSLTNFAIELERALNAAGGQVYSVSVNRTTRVLTISAVGSFTILAATGGNNGADIWPIAGFTTDQTGTALSSNVASGYEYVPQFRLQEYVKPGQRQETIDAVINETGSGRIEVVTFGIKKLIEMDIKFISNLDCGSGAIEYNATGYDDAQFFMENVVKRGSLEFMPDRDDASLFYEVSIESTDADSKGLKFKLTEETQVQGYYKTGKLVFRIIE